MPQQSIRHHYIPVFYTKRWAGPDGRICQFSSPYREVVPKRIFPAGTGYMTRLYELRGFEPHLAQQIEERFFSPVDSLAADALALMENSQNPAWTPRLRSAWSRFILSLLVRCPEDIELLRLHWAREIASTDAEQELRYQSHREPGDPDTFAEWITTRASPIRLERAMFEAYMNMLDSRRVGELINNMSWRVANVSASGMELMTSDRPVIMTNGLERSDGHIVLPIGPSRLFIACHDPMFFELLKEQNASDIVRGINHQIVSSAVKFAYASTDKPLRFVQKHFQTEPQPRMIEKIMRERDNRRLEGLPGA